MKKVKLFFAFSFLQISIAWAGGPGSGRHKEHFDNDSDGGLFLAILLLTGCLILLVMAVITTISRKVKLGKAKRVFQERIDLLLKNQEINYDEYSDIMVHLNEKGLNPAIKSLDVINERRTQKVAVASFIKEGDLLMERDEVSVEAWKNLKAHLTPQLLFQAQTQLEKLKAERRNEKDIEHFIVELKNLYSKGAILEEHWIEIRDAVASIGLSYANQALVSAKEVKKKYDRIISKYGRDKGTQIFDKQFFLGMTKEELIDSTGEPTKIEQEVMKTKTKETWIYGNKSSGDVFVFENELLARFKDR